MPESLDFRIGPLRQREEGGVFHAKGRLRREADPRLQDNETVDHHRKLDGNTNKESDPVGLAHYARWLYIIL